MGSDLTAVITVKDNDVAGVSGITISGTTPVTEGDPVKFSLSAVNPALTGDDTIMVRVQVTETGDFLATSAKLTPRIMNVMVDSTGGELTLPTTPDAENEDDAQVVARIISEDLSGGASATYTIGENPAFTVTVEDNDNPTLPSINIVAVNSPVDEADGAMAQFNITATGGTSGDTSEIMVELQISEVGNFLKNPVDSITKYRVASVMVTPGTQGCSRNRSDSSVKK